MVLASDLLDSIKELEEREKIKCFVMDGQIIDQIKSKIYDGRSSDRLEKPATIRKVATAKGWYCGPLENKTARFTSPDQARIMSRDKSVANAKAEDAIKMARLVTFHDYRPRVEAQLTADQIATLEANKVTPFPASASRPAGPRANTPLEGRETDEKRSTDDSY